LAKIDAALEAVEKAGVKLQIGFNRRFDPNFRKVRAMVADGKIGDPHIIRITSRDPAPPPVSYVKVSGGMFLDMTIHDFDMARYLSGSEVEEVYVAAGVMVDRALARQAMWIRRHHAPFANGAIALLITAASNLYARRVECSAPKAWYRRTTTHPITMCIQCGWCPFSQAALLLLERAWTRSLLN
jgi:myo-inositol 2-dehydrogenase/D-chiro-inositol 1-dehydrogenase